MTRTALALAALSVAFSVHDTSAQERITLGDVLVFRTSIDEPSHIAGAYLFKADRGRSKGQYLLLTMTKPRQPGALGGAEYHLLSPDKTGPRPQVDVLGVHYVKVRPDRRDAFERFVEQKLHPAVANLRPDLRILYYRRAGGDDGGNYLAVFALTKESRDKYWPGGSDSNELRTAFSPAVKSLTPELSTYLVEGSYAADPKLAAAVFESREWTDYVLVGAKEIKR